jgi:spore coat polysaccharide biosynthesis predicted glycosyltransferase SpsG
MDRLEATRYARSRAWGALVVRGARYPRQNCTPSVIVVPHARKNRKHAGSSKCKWRVPEHAPLRQQFERKRTKYFERLMVAWCGDDPLPSGDAFVHVRSLALPQRVRRPQ